MTEKGAEDFIPGVDDLDVTKSLIDFNINDARIAEAAEEYKEIDAYKDLTAAKAAKKTLVKMRSMLSEAHREQKAEALAHGQKLDAEKRRLLGLIEPIEDPITNQLDAIKNKAKLEEDKRIAKIEERIEQIRDYGLEIDRCDLVTLYSEQEELAAIEITEDEFMEFRDQAGGAKAEAEGRLRHAISKRQEYEEEQARLEQQRKDQEEQQRKLDEQQARMDAEETERNREAAEEAERKSLLYKKEQAERQAGLDAQAEAQRREQEGIDRKQAEQDKREREERERKEVEEKEALLLAQAPDVDKLLHFGERIAVISCNPPTMKSEAGQMALSAVLHRLAATIGFIEESTEEMK